VPFVLGVDSSVGDTIVELRDADDGRVYGSGRAQHPREPGSGPGEQDPAVWWQALVEARHDAGGALGVAAVAAAAQHPGLVVLDDEGKVLRPALVGHATAATGDARRLLDQRTSHEWVAACGTVPSSALPIAKLAWMSRKEPELFDRIAWVLQPHDWLSLRLSRKVVTDRGGASGTGYWSPREDEWRTDLLRLVADRAWDEVLPTVLPPHEPAGDREGVVIGAGTGQAMAIALGLALEPGDIVLDTGGQVFTTSERPAEDPTGVVAGYADATGRFLPLVESIDAFKVTEHMASLLGLERSRFDQLVSSAPVGARGVVFVPPSADGRPGGLHGIRNDTDAEDVARATLEGVACTLLDAIDALRDVDVQVDGRVFLVGHGTRLHALSQVLADVGGRAVCVPKGDRAASGACVQAAAALHGRSPQEVAESWGLHDARAVEPDDRIDGEQIRTAHRDAATSAV
jgi:xylulokinase